MWKTWTEPSGREAACYCLPACPPARPSAAFVPPLLHPSRPTCACRHPQWVAHQPLRYQGCPHLPHAQRRRAAALHAAGWAPLGKRWCRAAGQAECCHAAALPELCAFTACPADCWRLLPNPPPPQLSVGCGLSMCWRGAPRRPMPLPTGTCTTTCCDASGRCVGGLCTNMQGSRQGGGMPAWGSTAASMVGHTCTQETSRQQQHVHHACPWAVRAPVAVQNWCQLILSDGQPGAFCDCPGHARPGHAATPAPTPTPRPPPAAPLPCSRRAAQSWWRCWRRGSTCRLATPASFWTDCCAVSCALRQPLAD